MSEYWKSTPKYWCKHCSLYVKDTPFERKQHESTGKHQGNLKRSLRNIQNDHERNERDKLKAKAEVERLNRVVGSGSTSSTGSSLSTPSIRKPTSNASSAADQKRQWDQLAQMGIQVPDAYQADMAVPGGWKTVSQPGNGSLSEESLSTGIRKRKLEDQDEEEEEAGPTTIKKGWGSTTRNYPSQPTADLDSLLSSNIILKRSPITKQEQTEGINGEPTVNTNSEGSTDTTETRHACPPTGLQTDHFDIDDKSAKLSEQSIDNKPVSTEQRLKNEGEVPNLNDIPEAGLTEAAVPIFKKRKAKATVK